MKNNLNDGMLPEITRASKAINSFPWDKIEYKDIILVLIDFSRLIIKRLNSDNNLYADLQYAEDYWKGKIKRKELIKYGLDRVNENEDDNGMEKHLLNLVNSFLFPEEYDSRYTLWKLNTFIMLLIEIQDGLCDEFIGFIKEKFDFN